jgi:hypothetical protein
VAADATSVHGERYNLLELDNIRNETLGLAELHAFDLVRNLTHVLVVHTKAAAAGLGGYKSTAKSQGVKRQIDLNNTHI